MIKKRSKRPSGIAALILIVLVIFAAIKISSFVREYNSESSKSGNNVTVIIDKGATPKSVGKLLEEKGLIKNKWTFIVKYKLNRSVYKEIYYGTYALNDGMCLNDIMKILSVPPAAANTFSFVIPEGYSVEMIAQKCEKLSICSKQEFIDAVCANNYNYEFIKHIPDGNYKYKLEGFLFPCTYEFYNTVTPHEMVDKMLLKFESEYKSKFSDYDNMFKNITVASIVEREAVLDSERAKIAGVIYNRVNAAMPLQVDATVVYAKSNGLYDMTSVNYNDLKVESPYNTYIIRGLTPGPICNPGIKSVSAAANPESHGFLFYHTDESKKDGSHIFTKDYNEHLSTQN